MRGAHMVFAHFIILFILFTPHTVPPCSIKDSLSTNTSAELHVATESPEPNTANSLRAGCSMLLQKVLSLILRSRKFAKTNCSTAQH